MSLHLGMFLINYIIWNEYRFFSIPFGPPASGRSGIASIEFRLVCSQYNIITDSFRWQIRHFPLVLRTVMFIFGHRNVRGLRPLWCWVCGGCGGVLCVCLLKEKIRFRIIYLPPQRKQHEGKTSLSSLG